MHERAGFDAAGRRGNPIHTGRVDVFSPGTIICIDLLDKYFIYPDSTTIAVPTPHVVPMKRTEPADGNDSVEQSLDRKTALSVASEDERTGVYVPDRRGFLAGTVASLAAALGFSVPAAATSDPAVRAAGEYDTEGAVRSAVADGTRELRSTLSEQGYLETAAAAELLEPDLLSIPEYLAADEGIVSYGTVHDGEPTAGISITRQFDRYDLKVVLFPETGETYAVVLHGGTDTEIVRPGATGGDGPSTQGHYGCSGCLVGSACDVWYDSGGQRWCIPKTIYECTDCGTVCHDDDFNCDSCEEYC